MQALELVHSPRRRETDHRCNREGVVRRELGIQNIGSREQSLRTNQITGIGRGLGRVDREARQPALLSSLDLAIPISPFDEPHAHPTTGIARQRRDPVDHPDGTTAIRLDGEPKAIPGACRRISRQRLDDIQRQIQTVGLLGIDRESDASLRCAARELQHARNESFVHSTPLQQVVARLQSRELYRDPRPRVHGSWRLCAQGSNCPGIRLEIARSIGVSPRALTQDIE